MFRSILSGTTGTIILLLAALCVFGGCAETKTYRSPAFTIAQNQQMVPILPFVNTLVPAPLAEAVFNQYVDTLNEHRAGSGFSWFPIIKEDLKDVERILSPAHIYISGELWSYIANSGCCSTELRIKSRLRIYRVKSRELLWETEIPLESFFDHDRSTLAAEEEKLGRHLADAMAQATLQALQSAKRIVID